MAGKNVEGQLELFSLFDSVEELEQKIKGAGLKEVQGEPVMEQCYRHRDTGETAVAAYLDYNRVYVADWGRKPLLYQFDSTKEAVGYYADWLDRHASDEAAVAGTAAGSIAEGEGSPLGEYGGREMKQEELCRKLTEMIAETKAQKLSWRLEVQTTEGNDASEKPIEEEHGTKWTIDECYASYSCNYRGKNSA